ncbi:uncharacterized protein FTOL_09037 [Fusarium torulosum]|uniref:Protein kinase domain-containing protein n=1 Tax=Fusarium torulosum TaxID=33205 RepID=A0AAE8MFD2_9HYPO|nr:uncharacterized protein FTOL_09037 [Fusarium torulosum]
MPTLEPLPPCPGPKLEAFTDDTTKHDLKILDEVGVGSHSTVMKVELDGRLYAIKFFHHMGTLIPWHNPGGYFCKERSYNEDWEPLEPTDGLPQSAIDSLLLDSTSFYNECRVFGRLRELGREDLAIKVYGYVRLDMKDDKVRQPFVDYYNNILKPAIGAAASGEENAEELEKYYIRTMTHNWNGNEPAFGIVKEWIPGPEKVLSEKALSQRRVKQLPQLLRNLHDLHKSGIIVQDLKTEQYIDGHLADFSHAWTIPHTYGPEGGLRPRWMFESMAAWDLKCFQRIIDKEKQLIQFFKLAVRMPNVAAWRDKEVLGRLRSRDQTYGPFLPFLAYDLWDTKLRTHDPPFDPGLLDWRAAQKKSSKESAGRVTKRKAETATGRGKKRKAKRSKKTEGEDAGGQ